MATNKTTKQLLEQEYKKELRRINRLIKKGEKQGFYWSESIIPKQPKRITEASIRKLKSITPDSLHKKSYQIDLDTGELVKTTSIKTNTTPKRKKVTDLVETSTPKTPKSNKKKKDKQDKKEKQTEAKQPTKKKKKKTDKTGEHPSKKKKKSKEQADTPKTDAYDDAFIDTYTPNQADIVMYNVYQQIDNFTPTGFWRETTKQQKSNDVAMLKRLIQWSISQQGEQATAMRLEQVGAERINYIVDRIMYDSNGERVATAMGELATILKGSPLSTEEAREIEELSEGEEWWESPT